MKFKRSSGVLLHPTCLPGPYGIGDIGSTAHRWVDFLSSSGCGLWQILPLGPTGYGDSPYQCFSSFAGNPFLISPDALLSDDLLHPDDLYDRPAFPNDHVDFGKIIPWKLGLLDRSFIRFQHSQSARLMKEMEEFRVKQSVWLDDFALFMALKEIHGGQPWHTWEEPLRNRRADALIQVHKNFDVAIQRQIYRQFIFFRQWSQLLTHAHEKHIQIIGDIPIFVAHDSADVWSNPQLFHLDKSGKPTFVAGVPPDYFAPTGQLWGNPLYRWDIHARDGYTWWVERIKATLALVDIIRIDHFRGFAGYWEVPGNAKTAEVGRWVPGPGKDFFQRILDTLGDLPIIAEDLGVITPDVEDMRDSFDLPGMRILQFGFDSTPADPFLPHNYPVNCIVYTGTHDNDTALGWYNRVPDKDKNFYRSYMNRDGSDFSWDLIRGVWSSVAIFGLAPMQDFLNLGNEARMNYPGNPSGNWTWRMPKDAESLELQEKIRKLNYLYSRLNTDSS
jgi:4-alpha-glucanotransferase